MALNVSSSRVEAMTADMLGQLSRQPDQAAGILAGGKLVERIQEEDQGLICGCQRHALAQLGHQVAVIGGDIGYICPVAAGDLVAQAVQQAATVGRTGGGTDEAVDDLCLGISLLGLLDRPGHQGGFTGSARANDRQAALPLAD